MMISMRAIRTLLGLGLLALAAACGAPDSKFKTYTGPAVTQVVVEKSARKMYLLHDNQVLKAYNVSLGNEPVGRKMFEGDGRTPEGTYYIDRLNPNSRYHLSVGISYPNEQDIALAQSLGMLAGKDIFIHGRGDEGNRLVKGRPDWTAGCIAVSDDEIEDVFSMLRPGVPITINP